MIEVESTIHMPPRTRLFSLPMRGSCGATQESLLAYSQRLSVTHGVPVQRMFGTVLLPEAGLAARLNKNKGVPMKNVISIDAASDSAQMFAESMSNLTGQRNLANGTFLHWHELLGQRFSLATSRRWCPHCLDSQRQQEHASYSLLWSPKAVEACPIHQVRLLDRCAVCGGTQHILSDAVAFGRCQCCNAALDDENQCAAAKPASHRDQFRAEAVAEMIAAGDRARIIGGAFRYRARLLATANQYGISLVALARRLKLSPSLFFMGGATSLELFLEVMFRLGVKPLGFLEGTAEMPAKLKSPDLPHSRWRRVSSTQLEATRAQLKAIVAALPQSPNLVVTVASVAQRLQITPEACYRHFQSEIQELREHNLGARPRMLADKQVRKLNSARAAMHDLFGQDGPYSQKSIKSALAAAEVHWSNKEAVAAANDELVKLRQGAA